MKKIVLTMAVVLAASVINAASMSWTINNIQSSPTKTVGAGWQVALFDSGTAFDYAEAVKAIKGQTSTMTLLDKAATEATTATPTTYKINHSDGVVYEANKAFSTYAVIFDNADASKASYYIVSDVVTGNTGATGKNVSLMFGNMTGSTAANKFKDSTWTATVPEPTSGLLLLVGGALLGLRRRRA